MGKLEDFIVYKYGQEALVAYSNCLKAGLEPHILLNTQKLGTNTNNLLHNNHLRALPNTGVHQIDQLVEVHTTASIIKRLIATRENPRDAKSLFAVLKTLEPEGAVRNLLQILSDFVRWEAQNQIRQHHLPNHVTSFGTGGDAAHTINISTTAAIAAAHFLKANPIYKDYFENIIKIGTTAVTGDIGSADIRANIENLWPENSGYLSLEDIGFAYSQPLLKARRALHADGILDIYKILFPGSNLSDAQTVVTGYSDHEYECFLRQLAEYHNHNSILVTSVNGNDEIMPGRSFVKMRKSGGSWAAKAVSIEYDDSSTRFLRERQSVAEQTQSITDILTGNCSDGALRTIGYNAALFFLPHIDLVDLESFGEKITGFLLSQRQNRTIMRP